MASSNVDSRAYGPKGSSYGRVISDAWLIKFDQAYTKAKFSFGKQSDFDAITTMYQEKHSAIAEAIAEAKKRKTRSLLSLILGSAAFALFFVGTILILTLPTVNRNREKINQESERLEAIVEEVYDAIEDEDYVLARAKAATIVYGGPSGQGGLNIEFKWTDVREGLLEIIDKAEQGLEYEPIPIESESP